MTGLYVLFAVLGAATVFGLWRQRTDGRMRSVPGQEPDVVLASGGAGAGRPVVGAQAKHDAIVGGPAVGSTDDSEPLMVDGHQVEVVDHALIPAANALDPVSLGQPLGARATLLQFSSAFCAPCRATRAVLGDVAGMVDGVAHIEVDAEANLDLVRRLDITRTPTVLVLDASGRIRSRAIGAPRRADVIAALGAVI